MIASADSGKARANYEYVEMFNRHAVPVFPSSKRKSCEGTLLKPRL
jgi:hypothetical protein